ncbi:kinase-like protein [Lentinus tigrinus ALCF2SS1-7]|uniref:kinase-like protein n=1 Tax=Lentinus tigrinus ALCF2SS1-7 TaxID=1328758 RepID=UPI0011660197|nr:kinase-like protein [Lentinus tigrinus ALCF2SS1-7]
MDSSCTFAPTCLFFENETLQEPLDRYRRGYLHPVAITNIIRPDPSTSASRCQAAPSGYRILHKLGKGGEATIWLAQEVDRLDCLVALKIFSAHCSSGGEREARALRACKTSPNTPGSRNVLSLLDDFTFTGPNGAHKVHVTEVVMPMKTLYPVLPARSKKQIAMDITRGLAHVHRSGFIHGGNIGCAMPSAFTEKEVVYTMSMLDQYDVTMVVPDDPALHSSSLPPYLLSPCDLLQAYKYYGGLEAHQAARLLDFGNARQVGEDKGTDDIRWVCPPPEASFAYFGCGGLEVLPTMKGDIWCLGALMLRLFTGEAIVHDSTCACLLRQAKFEGVIPPAWREYWDKNEFLRKYSDRVTPENAHAGWSRRRDEFIQENPDVDAAEVDLLISLIRWMLATDPDVRPSADEVLAHPWFAEDAAMLVASHADSTPTMVQDEHTPGVDATTYLDRSGTHILSAMYSYGVSSKNNST